MKSNMRATKMGALEKGAWRKGMKGMEGGYRRERGYGRLVGGNSKTAHTFHFTIPTALEA
jgi:hypothetical protein